MTMIGHIKCNLFDGVAVAGDSYYLVLPCALPLFCGCGDGFAWMRHLPTRMVKKDYGPYDHLPCVGVLLGEVFK